MKNSQVGLQPIKNFQRVVNPNHRRFHFSTNITSDGNLVVTMIADYKDNYYKKAGLQEGDEITAMNGKLFKDITYEEKLKSHEIDTFVFDIIRKGQALKLVVPVDKNEEQGD
jgi:C-terminal processing protease CtpA/Prc